MKYLIIILSFFYSVIQAQETTIDIAKYRCKYLLSYQPDSTDVYSKKEEVFTLIIGNEKSLFVSENTLKRDSVKAELIRRNSLSFNLSNIPKSAFSYRIVKDTHNNNITFYDNILRTYLSYDENMSLHWDFTNDIEKVDELECKIAYLNYAGRRYKTWYSTSISIPEGPYKFYGLPGLIVKIQDIKGSYTFELISFKGISNEKQKITVENQTLQSKKVSKTDFSNALKNQWDTMGQQLSQMGLTLSDDLVKRVQDRKKKTNNPIELKP